VTGIMGIRNTIDFSYEFELSLMNHNLNNEIETLFIPTDQKYLLLKSSSIKELARFGGNISEMVPPFVEDALRKKYNV
jgi:pantetheine-phosphate adenylyltransferase